MICFNTLKYAWITVFLRKMYLVQINMISSLTSWPAVGVLYTAIPNRELQGFYREIWVQGNSNYMLWQCTGFAGSFFVVKKGIPCTYYWISFGFITLTFMQSLNEFPCKISLSQGKACNGEMETNVMLTLLFYVAITGKIM